MYGQCINRTGRPSVLVLIYTWIPVINAEHFVPFRPQLITIAGHSARAMRLSFVGELGWELHVPNSAAVDVYKAIMVAGAPHDIVNAGYRAIDSLSIEKGYISFRGINSTLIKNGIMCTGSVPTAELSNVTLLGDL